MNIRTISAGLALSSVLLVAPGCKDFFDVNTDPINPTSARLRDLLPVSQAAMSTYLGMGTNGLGPGTSTLVSQYASGRDVGSYSIDGSSFTNQWDGLYTSMLSNNEQIIKQGTASGDWTYVGIAQLQKAYVFSIMVDMWGSLPYSQALLGAANQAPRFDSDADIYLGGNGVESLFALIDAGIDNLAKTAPEVSPASADLMYGGSRASWARFGRTLKLKLYNQIRKVNGDPRLGDLAGKVRGVLAEDLISSNADDFEFQYYASSNPDNRNLGYTADYAVPSRENFISPYFYRLLRGPGAYVAEDDATYIDPRLPYYFFNQKTGTGPEQVPLQYNSFITVPLGSTSSAASAANSNVRTLPGLYPVGGRYDNGTGLVVEASSARGAVAQRLLTYASRKFTEAEVRLMILNDVTGAEAAYEAGVEAAYNKLNEIATADGAPTLSAATVAAQVSSAEAAFNAAGSNEDKLRVIMKEKYVAGFGFGPDIYTDYRRTGYPRIKIPGTELNTRLNGGGYPRRLAYSADDLSANPNAPGQPNVATSRIFWDR